MKRILVVTPYAPDANSFWRCMGPLTYLAKESNHSISLTLQTESIGWPEMLQYDLVFCHRPCRRDDLTIMQIAANCNVPVWVDYDDWLFDLPSWNPNAPIYNDLNTQSIMAHCLAAADLVSCSTAELYNKFRLVNPNVCILPNAYRSDLFVYREEKLAPRNPLIYWRGTNTHDADLLSVKEGFQELKGQVIFMGGASWMLLASMKEKTYGTAPIKELFEFNRTIYNIRPKVMIFPLVDCFFNRCKSNIAYMEAMHAGAICVAPDMPEWKREGVITYAPHDSNSFREAVNQAFSFSEEEHQEILKGAFASMKEKLDISHINRLRQAIVHQLTHPEYKKTEVSPFDQVVALRSLNVLKGKENAHPTQKQGD